MENKVSSQGNNKFQQYPAGQRLKKTRQDGLNKETVMFAGDYTAHKTSEKFKQELSTPSDFKKFKAKQRKEIAYQKQTIGLQNKKKPPHFKTSPSQVNHIEDKKDKQSLQIPLTYTCTESSTDDIGECIAVTCTVKVKLIKDLNYKGEIFIQEDETEADEKLIGDFRHHSLNLMGNLNLLHNASLFPQSLSSGFDMVSTMLNKGKPIQQGILKWKIPTSLLKKGGELIVKSFEVIQKFQLSDGVLTISKGGKKLFEKDLSKLI